MADTTAIGAWLDAAIERLAHESGARPFAPPAVISGDVLARCEHFESFPGLAIPTGQNGTYLTPAACYHLYPGLQGRRLGAPHVATLVATCGRNEKGAGEAPGRLREFRMREIVFIGPSEWVSRTRDEWMARAQELARSLGLDGSLEPATDTFFGGPGRGRRLLQQLKRLKYELRTEVGGDLVAISSFNLHESFFTSRFDIVMADETPAASGCVAFGLERWTLAYAARHHARL
jgi:seryl-tRNA synthetase